MQKKWICKAIQIVGVMALASLLILGGWWAHVLISRRQPPATIADIAYDNIRRGRDVDYRIFIEENGELVPYLVLTADYGGNVLLLREHIMDESRPFNISPHGERGWAYHDFGAYYPDSHIDNFLNAEFKNTLGEGVLAAMTASDIVVTEKSSIGAGGLTSMVITRYVFLLSIRELGIPDTSISVPEGGALRFFGNYHARRVATLSDGRAFPYWTRSPSTWGTSNAFAIGVDVSGPGTVDGYIGVRPAFAVARTTPITTQTNITSGETFFVLDVNNQQ